MSGLQQRSSRTSACRNEESHACVVGLGWGESREQGWHVPPALSGCVVAVLMDNPLHSSKTLACNAYLPPHDALWKEAWSHLQQTISDTTIQLFVGGDFNAAPH